SHELNPNSDSSRQKNSKISKKIRTPSTSKKFGKLRKKPATTSSQPSANLQKLPKSAAAKSMPERQAWTSLITPIHSGSKNLSISSKKILKKFYRHFHHKLKNILTLPVWRSPTYNPQNRQQSVIASVFMHKIS